MLIQWACLEEVLAIIHENEECDVVVGIDTLGKEAILQAISSAFKTRVCPGRQPIDTIVRSCSEALLCSHQVCVPPQIMEVAKVLGISDLLTLEHVCECA